MHSVHFGDDGQPVQVTDFHYPGDEPVTPRADLEAARKWVQLLTWLVSGGEVVDAGRRALLLAYLLRLPDAPRTLRELGARLCVSHTHAARLCDKIRREIAAIGRNDHS